jgi:LysR family transcriptional regulator for bpeEF and oprC
MRPSMRVIEIFVRVAERGSFIAAARSLLLDPAAVSRAISGLEENLGILLFSRSTRSIKLTPEGARFYRHAAQMLRAFDETIRSFQADTRVTRQLRIGMAPALSRRMLLRAIPDFQERHPEVQLILLSINDRSEIGDEGVDILIRPRSTRQSGAEHRQPQGLVVRRLTQSPTVLCASPGYLERAGTPTLPSDLTRHACLALLTLERDVHDEWQFVKRSTREKVRFTSKVTAHGDELREAALAGCGIVRLLACHIEDELRSGTLKQVLPDWECLGGLPIVAIYRKTKPRLSPTNAFVNHLAREFKRYDNVVPVPCG